MIKIKVVVLEQKILEIILKLKQKYKLKTRTSLNNTTFLVLSLSLSGRKGLPLMVRNFKVEIVYNLRVYIVIIIIIDY